MITTEIQNTDFLNTKLLKIGQNINIYFLSRSNANFLFDENFKKVFSFSIGNFSNKTFTNSGPIPRYEITYFRTFM